MVVLKVFFIILIFFSNAFAEPQRIVSLAPNVTETLYYLEASNKIIAVSNYCNWPEEVKSKPKVGGMLNPSFEKILSLKPDLVVISRDGTPKEVYLRLKDLGVNVYVFAPRSLKELPHEIIKLGNAIGKTKKAEEVARNLQKETNSMKNIFNGQKALFIIWHEPITVAGESSHIDEIMKILGLRNIAKFSSMSAEEIVKENPDLIFLGTGHEINVNHLLLQLKNTSAVKKGNVFYVSDVVYHLSPRIIEGIKEIAALKIK